MNKRNDLQKPLSQDSAASVASFLACMGSASCFETYQDWQKPAASGSAWLESEKCLSENFQEHYHC